MDFSTVDFTNDKYNMYNEATYTEKTTTKKAKVKKFSASIIVDVDSPSSYQNIKNNINKAAFKGIANN